MAIGLDTKIGLDASELAPGVSEILKQLGLATTAIDTLLQKGQEFNLKGKQVAGGIEIQVDAYRKLEVQLGRVTKAQRDALDQLKQTGAISAAQQQLLKTVVLSDDAATGALRLKNPRLVTNTGAPSPISAINPENVAAGGAAQERLRNLFPAPGNATIQQISRYENSINRVGNLISSGKVTPARFQEIFSGLQAGKGLSNLTSDEQKLTSALANIGKGFQTAEKEASSFGLTSRAALRITEALLLKEAISALSNKLQQAVLEAVKFQIQISEIRTISQHSQSTFNEWAKSIRDVSDALGLPQADVAEAGYQAISNQVTKGKDETEKFLKATGEFARVGVAKISDAAELTSSAINAYGFSLSRTEEIQAKFFKAVELGRFRISDLANDFGRIAAPASALGVSFEEVLGGLATLTNQGVKANDAQTQLLNIILKLEKPSQRMRDLLKSFGTETGQSAIATFGFTGLLQKLESAAKGDVEILAELGGELRAIRGLTGLATNGKGDVFRSFTGQIQNDSQAAFDQAKQIRAESAGDRLTKEANKIKNFFIDDLGQSILGAIDDINERLKNNTGGFLDFAKAIQIGATALLKIAEVLAIYKVATTTINILVGATGVAHRVAASLGILPYTEAQKAAIIVEEKRVASLTTMQKVGSVAFSALSGAAKAVTFAFIIDQLADLVKRFDESTKKGEEFENQLKKIQNARGGKDESGQLEGDKVFQKNALADAAKFNSSVDAVFAPVLANQANLIKQANSDLDDIRNNAKQTSDAIATGFQTVQDRIKRTINEYSQNITKAKDEIKKSQKEVLSLRDTTEELILKLKQKFASPTQVFDLRNTEINDLTNKIRDLYREATPEAIDEARKLVKKLQQITAEDVEARAQLEVDGEKARRQALARGGLIDNSPIQPHLSEGIQRISDIEAMAKAWEGFARTRLKEQEDLNVKLKEEEQTRERLLDKATKEFLNVDVVNKAGQVKPEFKDPITGKIDNVKFTKEFEAAAKKILDLTTDQNEKDLLGENIEKRRLLILKEANKERDIATLQQRQLELTQQKNDFQKQSNDIVNARVQIRQDIDSLNKKINGVIDVTALISERAKSDSGFSTIGDDVKGDPIRKAGLQISQLFLDGINKVTPGRNLSTTDRGKVFEENRPLFEEFIKAQEEMRKATAALTNRDEKGNLTAGSKELSAFDTAKFNLIDTGRRLVGKFDPNNPNPGEVAPPGGASTDEVSKTLAALRDKVVEGLSADKKQQILQDNLRTSLEKFANDNGLAIQQNVSALTANTDAIQKLLFSLANNQPANIPAAQAPQFNVGNQNFGGQFHHGGLIKGPSGYDNLNIKAEAGEFIVNRIDTKKWLPQLIAMNRGGSPRIPGHYHEGGFVQTNVGDVNITLSGQTSPIKTVREMGRGIRREIRRGNLKLS